MPPIAVLIALADPTRCRIIEILQQGAQPVHVLAASFDISRPAISRHLRVLKQAKLIAEKKTGRENHYALHANRLKPVRDWLDTFAPTPKVAIPQRVEPIAVVAPATIPAAIPTPPKPVRQQSISQMGFDF